MELSDLGKAKAQLTGCERLIFDISDLFIQNCNTDGCGKLIAGSVNIYLHNNVGLFASVCVVYIHCVISNQSTSFPLNTV